jgi:hypothetical protein
MKDRPTLVYADVSGNIYDWPALEMAGASANEWRRLRPAELIPLPEGSELFLLPERLPVGFNRKAGRFEPMPSDPFDPAKPGCSRIHFTCLYAALLSRLQGRCPCAYFASFRLHCRGLAKRRLCGSSSENRQ